jgi:hypothetical protein
MIKALYFLLLVFLWPFNAADGEIVTIASNVPTHIGNMGIVKNIVIGHADKQEAISTSEGNGIYFGLIEKILRYQEALLAWPYGRCSGQGGFHTFCKNGLFDFIFDFMKTSTHPAAGINNAQTLMRDSGGGEPIVFEPITKSYIRKGLIRRGGWITVSNLVRQPEAGKNWANVGAELHVLRISGNNSLRDSDGHYYGGEYSIKPDESNRPYFSIILMFIACGLLFVLANIFVAKAVKRNYDPIYLCLAWFGGFISLVVPTLWFIWH